MTLARSAEEARSFLQPALLQLQDREKSAEDSIRSRLLEASETLAEVVGSLYQASRAEAGVDVAPIVSKAYAKLERALQKMEDLPDTEEQRRRVAQALALLFAGGVGSRSSCPPPRRSSTSMRAVRVPDSARPSKTGASYPSIELGEIELAALGFDPDVPESSPVPDVAPGSERRTTPRVAFEVEVGFVSESHFYAGLSMDVSDGGLFVATYRLQPRGSRVAVTFMLPNGHAITTDAVVRWVREESEEASPGMGLAFELGDEDRKQVRAFCERREPLFIDMD